MSDRHQQCYFVSLESLHSTLWVHEGAMDVQYEIVMGDDRADCLIERRTFDPSTYGRRNGQIALEDVSPVEHRTAILSLDQICAREPHDIEWARSGAVVWAARGMWGVPVEFGPKPEVESQISLP